MLDRPNWFWYTLAVTIFFVINVFLWIYQRRCKLKGIKPKSPFNRLKKHEKQILRWTDIFIITAILLGTIAWGSMLFMVNSDSSPDIPPEYTQSNTRLAWSINFLLLFQYSFWTVFMASLLSPFQKNIISIKRLILLVMCCVPLIFGTLYCIFDNSQSNPLHLKLLLGAAFTLVLINGPAILLAKSFIEFITPLGNTMRRRLGLPEWEETKAIKDSETVND